MDKMLYVAMTGAKQAMLRQAANANNLANVSTTGFKGDFHVFLAAPAAGGIGERTRSYVADTSVATDFKPGPLMATGRHMDIAIQGNGFLAVQGADGQEAYIRSASLQVNASGQLVTGAGLTVLGEGGPISVPDDGSTLLIGQDGTISAVPVGGNPSEATTVGQIKLVKPDEKTLVKGGDGLFRQRDGQPATTDNTVQLADASLEGSNVSATGALVDLISAQRLFDMQVRLMQAADQNSRQLAQVMSLNG